MVNERRMGLVAVARGFLVAGLLVGCQPSDTGSQEGGEQRVPGTEFQARIDELVAPYVERGDFSGVVYVGRGDSVLFARAYGLASHELGVPNTLETVFAIGSMSKQFTAAMILLLQEDGVLSVSDRLARFLPEHPRGREITLHQLLTHTAGVPDIYALPEYGELSGQSPPLEAIVAYLGRQPLQFEPGSAYSYSNGGFALLARVIEVASGQPFEQALQERILRPFGMASSGTLSRMPTPGLAQGYDPLGASGFQKAPTFGATWGHGSGSLVATAGDLSRWDRALQSDALLSADSRRLMFTDHGDGYGYGLSLFERYGDTIIEHDGRLAGYASDMARYVNADAVVILLSNVQSVSRDRLRDGIGALLLGRDPEARKQRPASRAPAGIAEIRELEGAYGFGPGLTVAVRAEGGGETATLYLRANEGSESEFFPTADGTFFSRTLYAAVAFDRDGEGKVSAMRYMPEGAEFRGERLEP